MRSTYSTKIEIECTDKQTDKQTTGKGLAAAATAMDELSAFPIDAVGIHFSTARLHTNLQIDRTANS